MTKEKRRSCFRFCRSFFCLLLVRRLLAVVVVVVLRTPPPKKLRKNDLYIPKTRKRGNTQKFDFFFKKGQHPASHLYERRQAPCWYCNEVKEGEGERR